MSAAPARFTFDLDLTRGGPALAAEGDLLTASAQEELRHAARDEGHKAGYDAGFAAGERSAASVAEQALAVAASMLTDRAASLLGQIDQARAEAQHDAVALSALIAGKLANALIAREPAAELEALLAECLAGLEHAPHLVIRCHPDLADRLRDVAAERAAASGFAGRLIVMGEPEIALADGRIEWADGGLVRDMDAVGVEIDARIAEYLAARGITVSEETDQ
jgi:flagellar assembly protein FliH